MIGGRRLTNLRYADDTTLLASTQEKAKKIFKDLILESAQYNMQINAIRLLISLVQSPSADL